MTTPRFGFRFEMVELPRTDEALFDLQVDLTSRFGAQGWMLASVSVHVDDRGRRILLVALQRAAET